MADIHALIGQYGYLGIFSLLMVGIFGLPLPDESILAFCGFLVYRGDLHWLPTVAAASLGSMTGVTISYLIGRTVGFRLVANYGHVIHLTVERMERVRLWLDRVGKWGLFFGYFVPGIRHLTALTAGTSKLSPHVFASYAYAGGVVWAVTYIVLGYYLGKEWHLVTGRIASVSLIMFGVLTLLFAAYFFVKHKRQN